MREKDVMIEREMLLLSERRVCVVCLKLSTKREIGNQKIILLSQLRAKLKCIE